MHSFRRDGYDELGTSSGPVFSFLSLIYEPTCKLTCWPNTGDNCVSAQPRRLFITYKSVHLSGTACRGIANLCNAFTLGDT